MNIFMLIGLSWAAEAGFAGIPLAGLPALGLGEPVFVEGADQWKAGLAGGFVTEMIEVDVAAAETRFAFQRAAIGAKLPELKLINADEAVGDAGLVLARRGNIVMLVRGNDAVPATIRLLAAVESSPVVVNAEILPVPAGPFSPGIEGRDSFGRRVR